MLARQFNPGEAAARPKYGPVLQQATVPSHRTGLQVISRQDQEQFSAVLEGQDAGRRERARVAVLLDAMQVQQANERKPDHLRRVKPADGWRLARGSCLPPSCDRT